MSKEEIAKSIDEGLKILKQEPSFIFNLEEIGAIEDLRGYLEWNDKNSFSRLPRDNHIETVLNLISRLQKENEELKEDKKALINGYKDTSDILNKRINCLFELLQQEGYLKFDNREQAIDYIDKLIKAGEENE